jgi:hypothetical protein
MRISPPIEYSFAAVLILFASLMVLLAILIRDGILPQQINHFGGENMDGLAEIGMFFIGLGILLLGCGLMWFISEWSKIAKAKGKK